MLKSPIIRASAFATLLPLFGCSVKAPVDITPAPEPVVHTIFTKNAALKIAGYAGTITAQIFKKNADESFEPAMFMGKPLIKSYDCSDVDGYSKDLSNALRKAAKWSPITKEVRRALKSEPLPAHSQLCFHK